ncbi:MAG: MBL fold metallo-hydrolase [Lachnospiraceae bacterium]|nr:MBL fold metallo-hydrolase [Lachnospiraceae bacterium]MDD3616967.1 MBL fold metallo-hydrolase [Lachnospiraceae bacterium]
MSDKMTIGQKVLGMVSTNCYFLLNKETKEMIIVDPADDAVAIDGIVHKMEGKPVAILLTHGHFDHIMAAEALRKEYNIKIYIHEEEKQVLESPSINLSSSWSAAYVLEADEWVKDGQELRLAGFKIQVIHTPGHTQGSACFYFPEEGVLVSGDTLFAESVGRTDFPTASPSAMKRSLQKLLSTLPENVTVLPGHSETTTIEHEKRYNPFA